MRRALLVMVLAAVVLIPAAWSVTLADVTMTETATVGDTTLQLNGKQLGTIEGDDFGTALLLVWLGDKPPSDELKAGLLGK